MDKTKKGDIIPKEKWWSITSYNQMLTYVKHDLENICSKSIVPIGTKTYDWSLRDVIESFQVSYEISKHVNQGTWRVGKNDELLYSEWFTKCSAILFFDITWERNILFHVDWIWLNYYQYMTLKDIGWCWNAIYIWWTNSRYIKHHVLDDPTVHTCISINKVYEDIYVDTWSGRWSMLYCPLEKKIHVISQHNHLINTFFVA